MDIVFRRRYGREKKSKILKSRSIQEENFIFGGPHFQKTSVFAPKGKMPPRLL